MNNPFHPVSSYIDAMTEYHSVVNSEQWACRKLSGGRYVTFRLLAESYINTRTVIVEVMDRLRYHHWNELYGKRIEAERLQEIERLQNSAYERFMSDRGLLSKRQALDWRNMDLPEKVVIRVIPWIQGDACLGIEIMMAVGTEIA